MFDTANTRSADTDALLAIRYFKGANGQAQEITVTLGENIGNDEKAIKSLSCLMLYFRMANRKLPGFFDIEMQSSFFWVLFFFSLL
jgi:hypothetical protein